MKRTPLVLISVCILFLVLQARAQNEFNILHSNDGFVYITFDFDPAPSISIGYARNFSVDAINRDVTLSIEVMKPIFLRDLQNIQFELGSRIRVAQSNDLKLLNRLSLILHSVRTHFYTGKNFSIEEALIYGRFGNSFYVAGETGYTKYLFNYIKPSEPEVRGKLYSGAGGKLTLGFLGGYTFENGLDFTIRNGLVKTERFKNFNPAGPPIFGNLGIGYLF